MANVNNERTCGARPWIESFSKTPARVPHSRLPCWETILRFGFDSGNNLGSAFWDFWFWDALLPFLFFSFPTSGLWFPVSGFGFRSLEESVPPQRHRRPSFLILPNGHLDRRSKAASARPYCVRVKGVVGEFFGFVHITTGVSAQHFNASPNALL